MTIGVKGASVNTAHATAFPVVMHADIVRVLPFDGTITYCTILAISEFMISLLQLEVLNILGSLNRLSLSIAIRMDILIYTCKIKCEWRSVAVISIPI